MQRILLRPSTGIASTLEALSILRHFEREFGREAFSLVQVFRDGQTKRHLGYIMVDTTEEVSVKILSQDEHYVQTMNPTGYNESSGPFVASRYKSTLQDVINSLRLEGSPSADKAASSEIQKILQIKVESATDGAFGRSKPIQQPIGNLPGQLQHRAPDPFQLRDLLTMFSGFAGKLKPSRI